MEVEEEAQTWNGRSWEEDMYWTHFQFTHFCRFLRSDFYHGLAIPTKFANNIRPRLPGTVTLKGPSGINWAVGVATSYDGTLFFSGGWKEFAQDHGLQASDLLVFRYNGHSQFDVLVLETESSCEKASSYFVPKKQGRRTEEKKVGGSTGTGTSAGGFIPSPEQHDGISYFVPKKQGHWAEEKKIGGSTATGSGGFIPSPEQHDGNVDGVDNFTGGPPPPEKSAENGVDTPPPPPRLPPPMSLMPTCPPFITELSNKQAKKVLTKPPVNLDNCRGAVIPEESKLRALRSATLAVTKDGFLTVMKATHVQRTFYMAVPYAWMKKHMDERERQDVILRLGEKEWPVKFKLRVNKNAGGLGNGWKKFVRDNNLQPYDVCAFDLGERRGPDPQSSVIVLEVQIFRCS